MFSSMNWYPTASPIKATVGGWVSIIGGVISTIVNVPQIITKQAIDLPSGESCFGSSLYNTPLKTSTIFSTKNYHGLQLLSTLHNIKNIEQIYHHGYASESYLFQTVNIKNMLTFGYKINNDFTLSSIHESTFSFGYNIDHIIYINTLIKVDFLFNMQYATFDIYQDIILSNYISDISFSSICDIRQDIFLSIKKLEYFLLSSDFDLSILPNSHISIPSFSKEKNKVYLLSDFCFGSEGVKFHLNVPNKFKPEKISVSLKVNGVAYNKIKGVEVGSKLQLNFNILPKTAIIDLALITVKVSIGLDTFIVSYLDYFKGGYVVKSTDSIYFGIYYKGMYKSNIFIRNIKSWADMKWSKPTWYPEYEVKPSKQGWVYAKNHNEVLIAIPNLTKKMNTISTSPVLFSHSVYVNMGNKVKLKTTKDESKIQYYISYGDGIISNNIYESSSIGISYVSFVSTNKEVNSTSTIITCGISITYLGEDKIIPTNTFNSDLSILYFKSPTTLSINHFKQFKIYNKGYRESIDYIKESGSDFYLSEIMEYNDKFPCKVVSSDSTILNFVDGFSFETYDKVGKVTITVRSYDGLYEINYILEVG